MRFKNLFLPLIALVSAVATVAVLRAQGPVSSVLPSTPRPDLEITVESKLGFEDTVNAIKKASEDIKFSVQAVHTVSETLKSKGFPREGLTIIEICNAKLAAQVLDQDIRAGLMIPCPIMVYSRGSQVFVSTFNAPQMAKLYEGKAMPVIALEVEKALKTVLSSVSNKS